MREESAREEIKGMKGLANGEAARDAGNFVSLRAGVMRMKKS